MPELNFKGKEFVFNHHLAVPHRPFVPDAAKSVGEPRLDGNLIIHGDNLHALKSLLPMYAGKVDCIFIDPPYNTGNEGWCYNDNVNSPMMQQWLNENPVGIEDGLRHDKWCAMMWPRLRLLNELLNDSGSLWITLDDNEVHRARMMLDEIFGASNCVGQLAWQKRTSRENRATLSPSIDHLLLYSKCHPDSWRLVRNLITESDEDAEGETDDQETGSKGTIPFSAQGFRKNQVYEIITPTGISLYPPKGRCWGATEPEFLKLKSQGRIYWPKKGNGRPRVIPIDGEKKGLVPNTLWLASEVGDTEDSKKRLMEIFSERDELGIHAPKPHQLVERIIGIATTRESIVLDSFAGSGTTAHSVLAANMKDDGDRKFILIECEDYADTLTAERVRRVINGYAFQGTQRETLLQQSLTFSDLKKADKLLEQIASIKNLEGHRFDDIKSTVKDGELLVEGVKSIAERVEGLGGGFTYCTLGEAVDLDRMLTGDALPSFAQLGALLFHMATNEAIDTAQVFEQDGHGYLGESSAFHVWLIYKPELDFLKSRDSALTLAKAKALSESKPGKKHLVFAAAKFVSQKMLNEAGLPVEFAPLPWALYRVERR
ncbi:site-specific DNA-methyltransferase [Accumulibacter sp.]|uniref:site-specific DNA-methyltransferase n=1 Tax=Accumulibacter sp. TaxID=2053492 RepID=UPI001A48FD85|nr:site-specific DNA-methyltransferase [Accumulibacter sp.]MBL8399536.1 site-specific DNA-methyltransferase [Accumulibacter sp.]